MMTPTKQEWLEFRNKFDALRKQVLEIALSNDELWNWYKENHKGFLSSFKGTQFEAHRYYVYHKDIAGSTSYEHSPLLDFPGEYSYEAFYRRTLQELKELTAT